MKIYTVKERTGGKATIGIGSAEEGTREADYHRGSKASRSIHGMCNKLVYQYSHRNLSPKTDIRLEK